MSYPVFTVFAGDVLPIFFGSYDANGASVTLTGLAVTDIEIYKEGGVTQRASDAGYVLLDTDGIDFDALTGIHGFSIDTGDNTDAGFYTTGAWFTVVVSAVTLSAQTVSFIAAQFRIVPAETVAGVPKVDVSHFNGTAGTFAAGRPEVNTSHVAGTAQTARDIGLAIPAAVAGAAGGLFIDGTNAATNITTALTTTFTGNLTGSVDSVTGAVGSVTAAVTAGTVSDKTGYVLSAAGVTAVWAEVMTGTVTAVQAVRGFIAAMLGKASGLATNTATYRNIADTKDVITATVDADGNRSAVTLDLA